MRGAVVLVAVLAGLAGWLAVWLTPLEGLERTVWNLGLRNLLPQLAPPLGETARIGLAAVSALAAALAGGALARLLVPGRGSTEADLSATAPIPAWRRPAGDGAPPAPDAPRAMTASAGGPAGSVVAAAEAPATPAGGSAAATAPEDPPVRATAPPIATGSVGARPAAIMAPAPAAPAAVIPDSAPVTGEPAAVPAPATAGPSPSPAPPPARPAMPEAAAPVPVPVPAPVAAATSAPAPMDEAARAAMLASLARIEAQLAEARQGPVVGPNAQLIARFEELDSRVSAQVGQIAQQLVEVAQLARTAARSPAAAPAAAMGPPVLDGLRAPTARAPRPPANRAELAAAIRELRASLDAAPGLSGAA